VIELSIRELFHKIMSFEPCSRTLKWEFGYWVGVLKRWHREGLEKTPDFNDNLVYGDELVGPGFPTGSPSMDGKVPEQESEVRNYYYLDEEWTLAPYDYWIFPKFEHQIFYENDVYIEYRGSNGIKQKAYKDNSSMPMFLDYPVKNRKDWQNLKKERLDIECIEKRFISDEDRFVKWSKSRTKVLGLFDNPVGFFGCLRWLIGEKNLFTLYYDDPGLIKDILQHLCRLWMLMAEHLTAKIEFDIAIFWEDMAGRQGSLISPLIFKEFMTPLYKELIGFLRTRGIKFFNVDCDGNIISLIPLFLEAGITSMYPFEQQAGNDIAEIRQKYPKLGIMGGIDKNILRKGKQYIDMELQKVPYLIEKGGYIPYIDHMIPPDSSWENFKYYRNKLNNIIEKTKII
jgi:hypothetical protein